MIAIAKRCLTTVDGIRIWVKRNGDVSYSEKRPPDVDQRRLDVMLNTTGAEITDLDWDDDDDR